VKPVELVGQRLLEEVLVAHWNSPAGLGNGAHIVAPRRALHSKV
jgi:hypothetical protein